MQRLRIRVNGHAYDVEVEELGAAEAAPAGPPAPQAPPASVPARAPESSAGAPGEVRAPMPGVVSEVRARIGQQVAAGDVVLILEAMKMDNEIPAPIAGTVREVRVGRGEQVTAQQVLVVLG